MDLSFDHLPLLVIFALPGFFWFHARQRLSPAPSRDPSTFELGLFSIGYSVIIVLLEGIVFLLLGRCFGITVAHIFSSPMAIFLEYPEFSLLMILVWCVFGFSLAYILAWYDPVDKLFTRRLSGSGRSITDVWHNSFALSNRSHILIDVIVHMKDGDIYIGFLKEYQQCPDSDGNRELSVAGVCYRAGTQNPVLTSYDRNHYGEKGFVLLNTRDIKAIDVHIRDHPDN